MMRRKLNLWLGFLFCSICVSVPAYWRSVEEVAEPIQNELEVLVKKDGSFEETIKQKFKILRSNNEEVRYYFYYTPAREQLMALEGKVVTPGKQEVVLQKETIQDHPLKRQNTNFDLINRVVLIFPRVTEGDEIELTLKVNHRKWLNERYFARRFKLGYGALQNIKVVSEHPLYLKVDDPSARLEVSQQVVDNQQVIQCSFKSNELNEKIDSFFLINNSWVALSSENNWVKLGEYCYQEWGVKEEGLPEKFQAMVVKVGKGQTETEQIGAVVAWVRQNWRYVSGWHTLEGRYGTHSLEWLAEHGEGDCKDFARIVASVLEALGYKTSLVLVASMGQAGVGAGELPDLAIFNHMMVKLVTPSGKTYWVNPGYDGVVFPDFIPAWGLVLGKPASYEPIPRVVPYGNFSSWADNWSKNVESRIKILTQEGTEASRYKGGTLSSSLEQGDSQLSGNDQLTNMEEEIKLVCPPFLATLLSVETGKTDENGEKTIGNGSGIYQRLAIVHNVKVEEIKKLNCELKNRWLSVKRRCWLKSSILYVQDSVILQRSIISGEEIKSKDFMDMQTWIREHFIDKVIKVKKGDPKKGCRTEIKEQVSYKKEGGN